jgi:hypothetical protein
MSRRMRRILLLGGIVFLAYLFYSSLQQEHFHYQVCVDFHGRERCSTAAGRTPEDAIRAAQEIACTTLANGRDENMVCLATPPSAVHLLDKK